MKARRSVNSLSFRYLLRSLAVGGDGLHVVEHHPPLGQHRPGLLRRGLKTLLTFPVVLDTGLEVLDVQVGGLRQVVEPVKPTPHVFQFRLGGLQPLPLPPGDAVHFLVHQLDHFPDVGLGENVGTESSRPPSPRICLAFSLGQSQAPLPRFIRDWQT